MNFSSLDGTIVAKNLTKFTICASIYVGFFRKYILLFNLELHFDSIRGHQAFYTLRKNISEDRLWFSLFLIKEDQTDFNYYGGSRISSSAAKLRLGDCKMQQFCFLLF